MTFEQGKNLTPVVYEINGVFMSDFTLGREQSVWLGNNMALRYEKEFRSVNSGTKKRKHALVIVSPDNTPISEEYNGVTRFMGPFSMEDGVMATSIDFNSNKYREGRRISAGDYVLDLRELFSVDGLIMVVKVSTKTPGLQVERNEEALTTLDLMEELAALRQTPQELGPQE